jgi:hypothetical protein
VDEATDIAVDSGGNAYVSGVTNSADFPTTAGAYARSKGSERDVYLAKLNAHGTALVYSTFLGGNAASVNPHVAVDASGQAYLTAQTNANNLPVTAGAISGPRVTSTDADAFLAKFNAQASAVLYGTYIGGSRHDSPDGIDLDAAANAYLTGSTSSSDFPVTAGAVRTALSGHTDAFAVKVNTQATTGAAALVFSTYMGGSGGQAGRGVAVTPDGSGVYLAVQSDSTSDFPSPDRHPPNVVVKLNASATAMEYASAVGPFHGDHSLIVGIDIDGAGNAYVAGPADDTDTYAWISRVDVHGVEAARFVINGRGTLEGDWPTDVVTDGNDNAFITGTSGADDFPTTASAAQRTHRGGGDAFVAKVSFADVATENVARGGTASATSQEASQYPPAMAVDGDPSTRWSSSFSDPQSLTIDLGARYHVQRVVLHWETAYSNNYELHISDDGVNWYPLLAPADREITRPRQDGGVDNHINLEGTGRYVRVYGRTRATPWGYSLWEVEIYGMPATTPAPPPGGVNLARGRSAQVSSAERTEWRYFGHSAVDGQMDTRWSSEFSDPQWIVVDLGARIDISRVVLRWETAFGRDYTIDVSEGDGMWRTVRQVVSGDGDVDDLQGLSAAGRFIRMHGTRRATPWGYSLWEFEVYGVISGAPLPDVVIYASDVRHTNIPRVPDPTAANGQKLSVPDQGWSSTEQPPTLQSGAPYADFFPVVPTSGQYHVWVRLKAQGNVKWNDSVWVQFSNATVNGSPIYEVGSNSALLVGLENCFGCGVQEWGWQDNAWWLNQPTVVTLQAGLGMLRVLAREDGVEFDQIVLSPARYMTAAPGSLKNDNTIVPRP